MTQNEDRNRGIPYFCPLPMYADIQASGPLMLGSLH